MTVQFDDDIAVMRRALTIAARGEGWVEPNPMVGAVIVDENRQLVGEGYHERFGGPHAEINALKQAGARARGATLFVTLEPCRHHGKTPPCSRAVIDAGVKRIVVAIEDPSPQAGGGIAELRAAGVSVEVGLCGDEASRLIAPFTTLTKQGRPFVIAKWAMTLDGKIASRTGDSRWISNSRSRQIVHQLRGRVDAIVVGIGTALADDPLLTARPPGPRTPLRIVIDSQARLPGDSQLIRTAREKPLLMATTDSAPADRLNHLHAAGVETIITPAKDGHVDLHALLQELGKRRVTNLLIEGGGALLGALFDLGVIDEVHAFIAPKLIGGANAPSPLLGEGRAMMGEAIGLVDSEIQVLGDDVYVRGRVAVRTGGTPAALGTSSIAKKEFPMPYQDGSKEELLQCVAGAFGCRLPVDREASISAAAHLVMLQAEDLPECLGNSLCGFLEWGVTDISGILALDALIDFLDVEQWDLLSDPETFSAEEIDEIRRESVSRERDLRGLNARQVSAIVEWLKYMKAEELPPGSMTTCESALRYWSLR